MIGDTVANLDELMRNPKPRDHVAGCVWELMRRIFSKHRIIEALLLLRLLSWSSKCIEDGHGSLAVIHKNHPQHGLIMVALRALAHSCRILFRPRPDTDPELTALRKKIIGIEDKPAYKSSGQSLCCGSSARRERSDAVRAGGEWTQSCQTRSIGTAAENWKNVDVAEQARWNAEGARKRARVRLERQDKLVELREALKLAVARKSAEEPASAPAIRMTNCRFTDDQIETIERMWATTELTPAEVGRRRRDALTIPDGDVTVGILNDIRPLVPPSGQDLPFLNARLATVVRVVAHNREEFERTVFMRIVSIDGGCGAQLPVQENLEEDVVSKALALGMSPHFQRT